MSTCVEIRLMFSALLDEELSIEQVNKVDKHLAACSDCQREWQALNSLDQQLQRLIKIDRVDEKIEKIDRDGSNPVDKAVPSRSSVFHYAAVIVAVAAVLLISFFAIRREPVPEVQPDLAGATDSQVPIVARLVRATGSVEILSPGKADWDTIEQSAGTSLEKGTRLRTNESVLCEVQTTEQAKIRLNETGELILHDSKKIELVTGQLWCLASDTSSLDIALAVKDDGKQLVASMTCPSSSEFQCRSESNYVSCDSVSPHNRETQLSIGSNLCAVNPGETVSIDADQNVNRKTDSNLITKVWQLPLLAIGNTVDPELLSSMTKLLAPIGRTKARTLSEQQIRRLGPRGAIPLLAYTLTETSPEQIDLRRTAIRLARDLADESSIDLLLQLKSDPDAFISRQATESLSRMENDSRQ